MERPKTQKEIQSLIGLIEALMRFISKVTTRCATFLKAFKGNKRYITWIVECDHAF